MKHPCKQCLVFVMCQTKLQDLIEEKSRFYKAFEVKSNHQEFVLFSFYLHIAHCDIFQDYINSIVVKVEGWEKDYPLKEALILEKLHEAFNIKIN